MIWKWKKEVWNNDFLFYFLVVFVVKFLKEVFVVEGKIVEVFCLVDKVNFFLLFIWEYKIKNCAKNCKWEIVFGNLVFIFINIFINESVVRVEKD